VYQPTGKQQDLRPLVTYNQRESAATIQGDSDGGVKRCCCTNAISKRSIRAVTSGKRSDSTRSNDNHANSVIALVGLCVQIAEI
jgi:hypothetical protein